jgi:hypothetical protein
MAQPAWLSKYLTMKPEVNKIFDDLDSYLNFCRFELREYNPAHLYDKTNDNYRSYQNSQRAYRGERKPYLGKNPRNGQSFSR